MQQLAYGGLTAVALVLISTLTNGGPHNSPGAIGAVIAGIITLAIMVWLRSTYSDTGSATFWEAAEPLRGGPIWRMTRAGYALDVGLERLIVPPKAARQIAGHPWAFVTAMRQGAEMIEARDWYGNVVYRAPDYRS